MEQINELCSKISNASLNYITISHVDKSISKKSSLVSKIKKHLVSKHKPKIHLYKTDIFNTVDEISNFLNPVVLFVLNDIFINETDKKIPLIYTSTFNILVTTINDLKDNNIARQVYQHASLFSRVLVISSLLCSDGDIKHNLHKSCSKFDHIVFANCIDDKNDKLLFKI